MEGGTPSGTRLFVPKLSPTQDFCCPNNGFDLHVLGQLSQLHVPRVHEHLGWLQICAEVLNGVCLGGTDKSKWCWVALTNLNGAPFPAEGAQREFSWSLALCEDVKCSSSRNTALDLSVRV